MDEMRKIKNEQKMKLDKQEAEKRLSKIKLTQQ
jgi:hypothetical protein